eukprot:COSAG05_NODE_21303_length_273_cov_0.540230_1_plen_41_part_10
MGWMGGVTERRGGRAGGHMGSATRWSGKLLRLFGLDRSCVE